MATKERCTDKETIYPTFRIIGLNENEALRYCISVDMTFSAPIEPDKMSLLINIQMATVVYSPSVRIWVRHRKSEPPPVCWTGNRGRSVSSLFRFQWIDKTWKDQSRSNSSSFVPKSPGFPCCLSCPFSLLLASQSNHYRTKVND